MVTKVRCAAALLPIAMAACATSDSILGMRAAKAKDYATAREAFRRDLEDALKDRSQTDVSRQRVLYSTYELGRMTGYTCDYAEAERLLREALRLGEGMPEQYSLLTPTLSELARLSFDAGKFQESAAFYERAIQRLDKFQHVKRDPIGVANYIDDYAAALERAGDAAKAAEARSRAASIRFSNPGKNPGYVPVYYRDVCGTR